MPPGPSPRRTRSQVAPDWTTSELFILVNEISAVENDCLKALSSYQKWKIVVENCTTQEVCRTLNQCRGKWNSLVSDYNMINQWDAKSTIGSYWELGKEKRKDVGLPLEFDAELFRVVDSHVRAQKDEMDTDTDSDPEAEAEFLDAVSKLGSKRKKRKPAPLKNYDYETPQMYYNEENHQIALLNEELHDDHAEESPLKGCGIENQEENLHIGCESENQEESPHIGCEIEIQEESPHIGCETDNQEESPHASCETENPVVIQANNEPQEILVNQEPVNAEEEPQESHMEETPEETNAEEKPQKARKQEILLNQEPVNAEEEPQESHMEETPQETNAEEKPQKASKEEKPIDRQPRKKIARMGKKEKLMAESLRQNADLIHAIVNGTLPGLTNLSMEKLTNVDDFQTYIVGRQAEKLIACLADIVKIVKQFPSLVQEGV